MPVSLELQCNSRGQNLRSPVCFPCPSGHVDTCDMEDFGVFLIVVPEGEMPRASRWNDPFYDV